MEGPQLALTPCAKVATSTRPLQSCLPGSALDMLRECGCLGIAQHPVRERRQDPGVPSSLPASPISCRKVKTTRWGLAGIPIQELRAAVGTENMSSELGTSSCDLYCWYMQHGSGSDWPGKGSFSWASQSSSQPTDPGMLGSGVLELPRDIRWWCPVLVPPCDTPTLGWGC